MELQILRENNYGQKNKDERVVMLITILYFFLKKQNFFKKIFFKKLFRFIHSEMRKEGYE